MNGWYRVRRRAGSGRAGWFRARPTVRAPMRRTGRASCGCTCSDPRFRARVPAPLREVAHVAERTARDGTRPADSRGGCGARVRRISRRSPLGRPGLRVAGDLEVWRDSVAGCQSAEHLAVQAFDFALERDRVLVDGRLPPEHVTDACDLPIQALALFGMAPGLQLAGVLPGARRRRLQEPPRRAQAPEFLRRVDRCLVRLRAVLRDVLRERRPTSTSLDVGRSSAVAIIGHWPGRGRAQELDRSNVRVAPR